MAVMRDEEIKGTWVAAPPAQGTRGGNLFGSPGRVSYRSTVEAVTARLALAPGLTGSRIPSIPWITARGCPVEHGNPASARSRVPEAANGHHCPMPAGWALLSRSSLGIHAGGTHQRAGCPGSPDQSGGVVGGR